MIDTSAVVEYLVDSEKGRKLEAFEHCDKSISTITVFEVYSFYLKHMPENADSIVDLLESNFISVPVADDIAYLGAKLKQKYKMSTADALILATAIEEGAELVTFDKDFSGIEEIKVHLL